MIKTLQTIKRRLRDVKGFTLIEAVAVLIILGVIAVIAISRTMSTDEVQLISEMNTLKGHLRFAQYKALNDVSGTKWGINVAGSSYTLVKQVGAGSATNPMILPGETSYTHNFGSSVTANVTGDNPILFDEWGRPGSNTAIATSITTVSMGSKTINIKPDTGFIP